MASSVVREACKEIWGRSHPKAPCHTFQDDHESFSNSSKCWSSIIFTKSATFLMLILGPMSYFPVTEWRYQNFDRNRYQDFFPKLKQRLFSETKFSETETFFRDQFFSKPKPRLFFRNQIFRSRNPQRFGKSFEAEKFRNRNVNLCLWV